MAPRAKVLVRARREDRERLVGKTPEELAANVVGVGEEMKTADDGFVPWLASQTDLLAEDWSVVE